MFYAPVSGTTPLHRAAQRGDEEEVAALLAQASVAVQAVADLRASSEQAAAGGGRLKTGSPPVAAPVGAHVDTGSSRGGYPDPGGHDCS